MPEQIREQHQIRRVRRRTQGVNLAETPGAEVMDEAARQQLSRLDAALSEYLTDTSAADSAAVVGLPQEHARARPLSDEALVRGFRQTRGE